MLRVVCEYNGFFVRVDDIERHGRSEGLGLIDIHSWFHVPKHRRRQFRIIDSIIGDEAGALAPWPPQRAVAPFEGASAIRPLVFLTAWRDTNRGDPMPFSVKISSMVFLRAARNWLAVRAWTMILSVDIQICPA